MKNYLKNIKNVKKIYVNVPESKLTLLATWETNESEGWGIETRNMTLFRELGDQKDGS